jgi:hypothetical protein
VGQVVNCTLHPGRNVVKCKLLLVKATRTEMGQGESGIQDTYSAHYLRVTLISNVKLTHYKFSVTLVTSISLLR